MLGSRGLRTQQLKKTQHKNRVYVQHQRNTRSVVSQLWWMQARRATLLCLPARPEPTTSTKTKGIDFLATQMAKAVNQEPR